MSPGNNFIRYVHVIIKKKGKESYTNDRLIKYHFKLNIHTMIGRFFAKHRAEIYYTHVVCRLYIATFLFDVSK